MSKAPSTNPEDHQEKSVMEKWDEAVDALERKSKILNKLIEKNIQNIKKSK